MPQSKPKLKLWTRDEFIVAFNLYLTIEYKKINDQNTDVIKLANLINRSPGSISIRLANFASVDPYHQQRGAGGLKNGGAKIQSIWNEFSNNKEELIFQSEKILAEKENISIENKYESILFDLKDLKGEMIVREIKTRVNQYVFRKMVLANYSSKCAITGIDIPELLFASHIIPWSKNENERMNAENGICLSALYDKAFDKGLISINTNHEVIFSSSLKNKKDTEFYKIHFAPIENQKINSAQKYLPRKDFLEYHLDTIFKK
ncbi:HNH endonuclease [Flavobacterium sp. MC2016-06]|jgi:putative restriction endonuclease|uniref:HNH endonuclease n=1 Tax=Flavobacterium sp. MC2016-06 TaxID=2676308 RepID=UPI0012BAD295|nr:HNH endonuclease [Flavobacterium sp. MC2016-06]MBU3862505.1 HNH endonuclease [Flavobacterium sp. MC2016-06]